MQPRFDPRPVQKLEPTPTVLQTYALTFIFILALTYVDCVDLSDSEEKEEGGHVAATPAPPAAAAAVLDNSFQLKAMEDKIVRLGFASLVAEIQGEK